MTKLVKFFNNLYKRKISQLQLHNFFSSKTLQAPFLFQAMENTVTLKTICYNTRV